MEFPQRPRYLIKIAGFILAVYGFFHFGQMLLNGDTHFTYKTFEFGGAAGLAFIAFITFGSAVLMCFTITSLILSLLTNRSIFIESEEVIIPQLLWFEKIKFSHDALAAVNVLPLGKDRTVAISYKVKGKIKKVARTESTFLDSDDFEEFCRELDSILKKQR